MPVFHQIEGLVVDRGITFGDLAGTLEAFTKAYFGGAIHSRLRPSYFPFTEPSAEYDINCLFCEARAAARAADRLARARRLRHGAPQRVRRGRHRPRGVVAASRSASASTAWPLMRYGIDDLRDLFSNDVRFLEQF